MTAGPPPLPRARASLDTAKYDIPLADSAWDRLKFGIEHRLLSPGTSDMARLRGYARLHEWRQLRSPRQRLFALKVAAKLPARALRAAREAVSAHGEWAQREAGVSRRRQTAHLWWLAVRHGIDAETYYSYRLFRPDQLHRAPLFFQTLESPRFFRMLAARTYPDTLRLLQSKVEFERWLVAHDLPTVRTLIEFTDGGVARSTIPDGRLPPVDLFSKPNDALGGRGTERWTYDGEGWLGEDGRRRSQAALVAELTENTRQGGSVLLQERMRNHPALAPLAPATLSTVRLVTLRGLDDQVRVVIGVAKIPAGNAAADHMRLGGVAAPIDVATGRLGAAVRKDKRTMVARVDQHPDTGAAIPGFQLPLWEETKALAVRAHEALGSILCVGWDIAILADGPIIVEGNSSPGGGSSQLPSGVGMGETIVTRVLAERLRASFAATRRPDDQGR